MGAAALVCFGLVLHILATSDAFAQDREGSAEALFARGVALAEAGAWEDAAEVFEACAAEQDRPAVRFNLVLAYEELAQPADVVRHAEAFLRFPEEPHREQARTRVQQALRSAREALGRKQAEGGAASRPPSQGHSIEEADGAPASGPGLPSSTPQGLERGPRDADSNAASRSPAGLTAALSGPSSDSVAPSYPSPRWRTRLAWAFGVMGASLGTAALATYIAAERQADDLAARDPYQTGSGFLTGSDQYLSLTNALTPLALSGAALMATAVPLGPTFTRRGSSVWALSALALATGALATGLTMMIRDPDYVGSSRLAEPSRKAGALLVGAAAPLFSYAFTFGFRKRSERHSDGLASRASQGAQQ